MSVSNSDFVFEILKYAPWTSPTSAPIQLDPALTENFSAINRATERDLLSFKTGDITLGFNNRDGSFDDLFAFFGPADRWQLRIYRRGVIQFWGSIIGKGSIRFDRTEKTCEITAYGLTRQLKDKSAETLKRTIAVTALGAAATGGNTSLTLDSTSGLLTGDTLHVTDHLNAEDVTVKQVTSATVVSLEAAITNSYANASPVTCTTPYYRYKSVGFLADALFSACGIVGAEIKLSNSQFKRLAPTPVNLGGLPAFSGTNPTVGNQITTNPAERSSRRYETLAGDGAYYQASPDAEWVKEDSTVQAWVDWSRYYNETEAEPTIILRDPYNVEVTTNGHNAGPHKNAWDYKPATKIMYIFDTTGGQIYQRTSTDGTTWTAVVRVTGGSIIATSAAGESQEKGVELDPVRQLLYVWSGSSSAGVPIFCTYAIGSGDPGTQTSLRAAGDSNTLNVYGGFQYVPELDCVIGLKTLAADSGASPEVYGTQFHILAFRGNDLLWERPFPPCIVQDYAGGPPGFYYNFPTYSLRFVQGNLYCVCISDGKAQLIVSADQFQSNVMRPIAQSGTGARLFASRVNGAYQITGHEGTEQRGHLIAAPFYAGVVPYFDMTSKSVLDGLGELSRIVNALSWVDDDAQAHFVARDLFDPGTVLEICDRIMSRIDDQIWDETAQFATVSGGGVEAVSGDNDFASEGIDITTDLAPNEAFAQALADQYFDFFGKRRKQIELTLHDPDGHIYRPLDRVTIDGIRYMVYESDHDLSNDEISLTVLEDA